MYTLNTDLINIRWYNFLVFTWAGIISLRSSTHSVELRSSQSPILTPWSLFSFLNNLFHLGGTEQFKWQLTIYTNYNINQPLCSLSSWFNSFAFKYLQTSIASSDKASYAIDTALIHFFVPMNEKTGKCLLKSVRYNSSCVVWLSTGTYENVAQDIII